MPNDIGARLREARKQKGYTQQELADRTGYTFSAISTIELGKQDVPLKSVKKLAEALGVSAYWLAFGEDEEIEEEPLNAKDVYNALVSCGLITNGRDLSPRDADFLKSIICAIDTWFN